MTAAVHRRGGKPVGRLVWSEADSLPGLLAMLRDGKRIALVGHSEGASVALITAGRDGKVAAVASVAGAGGRLSR